MAWGAKGWVIKKDKLGQFISVLYVPYPVPTLFPPHPAPHPGNNRLSGFLVTMAECRKQVQVLLQPLAIMFANIPLARASHMAKFSQGAGKYNLPLR